MPRKSATHSSAAHTAQQLGPYVGEIDVDNYLAALADPQVQATLQRAAAQIAPGGYVGTPHPRGNDAVQ
ncbi:MAG: hypothetical protein ACRDK4_05835 [Solirubrobacteraceae bacterium]